MKTWEKWIKTDSDLRKMDKMIKMWINGWIMEKVGKNR